MLHLRWLDDVDGQRGAFVHDLRRSFSAICERFPRKVFPRLRDVPPMIAPVRT
ncbi:MAG: hypothetical protein ABW352_10930 [Polyangiales bacterium]